VPISYAITSIVDCSNSASKHNTFSADYNNSINLYIMYGDVSRLMANNYSKVLSISSIINNYGLTAVFKRASESTYNIKLG
jgi:hypothetical protein